MGRTSSEAMNRCNRKAYGMVGLVLSKGEKEQAAEQVLRSVCELKGHKHLLESVALFRQVGGGYEAPESSLVAAKTLLTR